MSIRAFFAQLSVARCCAADVNADGFVNSADFFDLLAGLLGGC